VSVVLVGRSESTYRWTTCPGSGGGLEEDELRHVGLDWFGVTTDQKVAMCGEACTPAIDASCTRIFAHTVSACATARR
jgi:hypothetical protein